jgi:hypothetical protein
MLDAKKERFYAKEALQILRQIRGPVDSFTVTDEKEVLSLAVESGRIEPGSFRNCAVFSDEHEAIEQKKIRYEAHRAAEILKILEESREDISVGDWFAELYTQQTMARAVLVEAARKYIHDTKIDTLTPRHEALYSHALDDAQAELFPRPEREVADYASHAVIEAARLANPDQANELIAAHPFLVVEAPSFTAELSFQKRGEWKALLEEKYEAPFEAAREAVSEDGLSNATLAAATVAFMKEAGFPIKTEDGDGWEVIGRDDVAGFRVEPTSRQILCGRRKKEVTWPAFKKLMLHEVGIHAARAENGFKLGYDAVQNGLPGYQEFEEGLSILIEKLSTDEPLDSVGRDHYRYLAVCFADGFLDGERHTEEETLEFVSKMIAARKPNGLHDDGILLAARKTGFDHVKRAFRGMPEGKTMYSNLAYLAGKMNAIRFLASTDLPAAQVLAYLQAGKFNPTDELHVTLMKMVGAELNG